MSKLYLCLNFTLSINYYKYISNFVAIFLRRQIPTKIKSPSILFSRSRPRQRQHKAVNILRCVEQNFIQNVSTANATANATGNGRDYWECRKVIY